MSETLCELARRDRPKDRQKIAKLGGAPQFVCRRCGRGAPKKKWLCKPDKVA